MSWQWLAETARLGGRPECICLHMRPRAHVGGRRHALRHVLARVTIWYHLCIGSIDQTPIKGGTGRRFWT